MIEEICYKYGIENYTINSDGSIDVDGSVNISERNLTKIPLKFNKVTGSFYCYGNPHLINLIGSPKYVGGSFDCDQCDLTTLEGCPEFIGKNFICESNKLTSLVGSPKEVVGDLYFFKSEITDLTGFDCKFRGIFYCDKNPISSIFDVVESDFIYAFKVFQVIKGNEVNLKRLKYVMDTWNLRIKTNEIEKYYTIV